MSKNLAIIDYFIYLCLCVYLVVDTINGITMIKYNISISQAFKSLLLFFVIISVLFRSANDRLIISLYFFILFLGIGLLYNKNRVDINSTALYIIKLITIPIFYMYFCSVSQKTTDRKNNGVFKNIFTINCVVLLLNIFISVIGYGYTTYEDYGAKGYFYAGNEVSILFYCFYYYLLMNIKYTKQLIIIYPLALVCSILLGTKTGVLSIILLSIIDFYYRQTKRNKLLLRLFLPVLMVLLGELLYIVISRTQFYQFLEYRLIRHIGKGNLLNLLLSGRITFLENTCSIWSNNLSLVTFLFGIGLQYPVLKGIEIDFFDTFFSLGIVWLAMILFFYIKLIYLSIIKKNKMLFFFNIIMLLISFTAGHVWSSVMAGVFFAYINAYELRTKIV